jgi:excisionase family DNA binding protein
MAKILTTKEAAERLGVTTGRVRAMIAAGRLRAQKFGRDHQIREADLELVLERHAGRPPLNGRKGTRKQ